MRQMKTARGDRHEKAKELKHLDVIKATNGGHIVTHHYDNSLPGDGYHESEPHAFSEPEQGEPKPQLPEGHVLHHIAKHMGIPHEVIDGEHENAGEANEEEHLSESGAAPEGE